MSGTKTETAGTDMGAEIIGPEIAKAMHEPVQSSRRPLKNKVLLTLVGQLREELDKSGEHQWTAGYIIVKLREKKEGKLFVELADIAAAMNHRYSISYLSILGNTAKMFPDREMVAALGATWMDCNQARSFHNSWVEKAPERKGEPYKSLEEFMALKAEYIELRKRGETAHDDAVSYAKSKSGYPYDAETLKEIQAKKDENKAERRETIEKFEKKFLLQRPSSRWYGQPCGPIENAQAIWMARQLAKAAMEMEGDGWALALEIAPDGKPRVTSYASATPENKRLLCAAALLVAYEALGKGDVEAGKAEADKAIADLRATFTELDTVDAEQEDR